MRTSVQNKHESMCVNMFTQNADSKLSETFYVLYNIVWFELRQLSKHFYDNCRSVGRP